MRPSLSHKELEAEISRDTILIAQLGGDGGSQTDLKKVQKRLNDNTKHKNNQKRKSSNEKIKEEPFVEMEPAQDVENGFGLSIFNACVCHFLLPE